MWRRILSFTAAASSAMSLHVVELPLRVRDTPSGRETVLSMLGGLDALGSAQAGGGPTLSLAAAGEPAIPLAHALQAEQRREWLVALVLGNSTSTGSSGCAHVVVIEVRLGLAARKKRKEEERRPAWAD